MAQTAAIALNWTEQGYVPDVVIRAGIRRLLGRRLEEITRTDCEAMASAQHEFVQAMCKAPLAVLPEKANEQHYEVPAEFFAAVLGPHRKYSCCHWPAGVTSLDEAESAALAVTCERA